jgi:hypothetical protein
MLRNIIQLRDGSRNRKFGMPIMRKTGFCFGGGLGGSYLTPSGRPVGLGEGAVSAMMTMATQQIIQAGVLVVDAGRGACDSNKKVLGQRKYTEVAPVNDELRATFLIARGRGCFTNTFFKYQLDFASFFAPAAHRTSMRQLLPSSADSR